MTSLLFLLTVLTLLVLLIRMLIKLTRRKIIKGALIAMGLIIVGYGLTWTVFKLSQKLLPIPLGTQVCFDDWCATVVKAERQTAGDSTVIVLHIEMFNNARGISQKPSEPRIHILDTTGKAWYIVKPFPKCRLNLASFRVIRQILKLRIAGIISGFLF